MSILSLIWNYSDCLAYHCIGKVNIHDHQHYNTIATDSHYRNLVKVVPNMDLLLKTLLLSKWKFHSKWYWFIEISCSPLYSCHANSNCLISKGKLPPGQQTVVSGVAPIWHQKFTGHTSLLIAEQKSTCPAVLAADCPTHGFSGRHRSWQAL